MNETYRQDGDITPIIMNTQPIIPLVYNDSLSYLEVVSKVAQKTNEVIDKVNNLQVDILALSKEYTDKEIEKAISVVNEAVKEVEKIKNELDIKYIKFEDLTSAKLSLFNDRLDAIDKRIDATIISINERTDLAIQQNNEYIINNISKYLSKIKVINFFTGLETGIQGMFDYLSLLHVENGLNYNDLVGKNITYETLAGLHIDFTTLVLRGGIIL